MFQSEVGAGIWLETRTTCKFSPSRRGQFEPSDRVGQFAEFLTGLGSDTQSVLRQAGPMSVIYRTDDVLDRLAPGCCGRGRRDRQGRQHAGRLGRRACALDNELTHAIKNCGTHVLSEHGFEAGKTEHIRFVNDISIRQLHGFRIWVVRLGALHACFLKIPKPSCSQSCGAFKPITDVPESVANVNKHRPAQRELKLREAQTGEDQVMAVAKSL